MTKSILLCGVGGQGTILCSRILTAGLTRMGYDVKMSEIHGMSQRGGSVTTQIRFGERVYAPGVGEGEADVIVAFEAAEALRALPYLRRGGKLLMDSFEIYPVPVLTGELPYPAGIAAAIAESGADVTVIEAMKKAEALGNTRAQNVVLLGALTRALGMDGRVDWEELVRATVPPKSVELNLAAYRAGHGD